ncbi:MAG: beta-lactamase family protein [Acidobacteriota bacterium]|nr:beta-lactamase family protein [Acidobacteriota bacterium]
MSHVSRFIRIAALCALAVVPVSAREEQQGPPPEIRTLLTEFFDAYNSGKPAEWEAMAKKHFTPALLAKRDAAGRKALYEKMRAEFGALTRDRVERSGPDAPLSISVKGANGASATITMTLDGFRIDDLSVETGDAAGGQGERESAPPVPINARMAVDELTRALDGHLTALAAADRLSGVVLVARDGTPVFERAYGYAERGFRVPNTTATRFNLGSINKTFTQVANAQLQAQEKLAYAATLGSFLGDYPQEATRAATIDQLLGHTAGIADFFGPDFNSAPKDQFRSNADYFRLVSSRPALFAPGARNQYCNGCYITLGAIIEKVTGMPYEAYVAENVFKKAGMTGAGYPRTDAIEANVAEGYTRRVGDGTLRRNVFSRGVTGSAAGGGYATAADLLAYDNALRAGRLVDSAGMERILRSKLSGGRAMGAFGIAGGAPGISSVLESDGVWTVIVLTNLDPGAGEDIGVAIMRALRQ